MVASHGGSPSGRFTAVRGRSSSPDLVPGLRVGEGAGPALVLADVFLVVPDAFLPVDASGGDVLTFIFVGDDDLGVNTLLL